ncbi:MAG: hypothetical protein KC656_37010, partial [Myxococcales bacterium]|nr:hypothetical protein [Myxococcales bacterium]
MSGLSPSDIGLLECHATGTPVGDATELRSMARVFEGLRDVPIGSLKSNLGHLVTVAGVAGVMKVLGALAHDRRPATLNADVPTQALDGSPFRLLQAGEAWSGPRRAAVSAFGFGGNNGHCIVEAFEGRDPTSQSAAVAVEVSRPRIAIVSVGARVGNGNNAADFEASLFDGAPCERRREQVDIALKGLKSPPRDLQQSLSQQTLVLEA